MLTSLSTGRETGGKSKPLHYFSMGENRRVSAEPLFKTFKERGDMASFAQRLNISLSRLMNWKKRGIPHAQVVAVAHAMNLASTDDYYKLARGNNVHKPKTIPLSEGEKLLALVETFLDTDTEGQFRILEAAKALGAHGRGASSKRRTARRR